MKTRADPDGFDLKGSLRILTDATRDNKALIALTCLATLGLAALSTRIRAPLYRAEATIMVEKDIDTARDSFYANWGVFRKDDARTEIELMIAGPILKEVIEKEKLTYDDVYHPIMSELSLIWQKSWPGRQYRALKRRHFPDADDALLSSPEAEIGKIIVDMRAGIAIDPVSEANVGRVRVKGPSPRVARIANTLLDTYMVQRQERYQREAQQSLDMLSAQTDQAARELDNIAKRRLAFAREKGVTLELQKEIADVNKLPDLEMEAAGARMKASNLEATLAETERQLASEPETRTATTIYEMNTLRETLKAKRLDVQTTLLDRRGLYREEAPEIRELKADLEKLDALITQASEKVEKSTTEALNEVRQSLLSRRDTVRAELAGLRAGLAMLDETVSQRRLRVAAIPEIQTQMRALDREHMLAQEKYQQLVMKRTQAAMSWITVKATMPSMRVIEYATPGPRVWPKAKILYPCALLAGLLMGLVAALARNWMTGLITAEHVRQSEYPLYGAVRTTRAQTRLEVISRSRVA